MTDSSDDDGVTSGGHGVWIGPGASRVVIRNSRSHHNAMDGFHFAGGSKVLVEDSEAFANGRDGFHIEGGGDLRTQILALPEAERRRLKRFLSNAKTEKQMTAVLRGSPGLWTKLRPALHDGAAIATVVQAILQIVN